MTATRDRRSDPGTGAEPAWDDRPIIGQFRGLPWWAAVLLAFGVTALAAVVDMKRQGSLGWIYHAAFAVGCVSAVAFVKRRSLFGPMVQPPLVFAITAVAAVALLDDKPSGGGLGSLALSIALPLTSNFPIMGITTAVVVGIGSYRLWRERDPNPQVRPNKAARERVARGADDAFADDAGPGAGGRGSRERPSRDLAGAPPRRGRSDLDDLDADDDRGGRRSPAGGGRLPRDPGGRDAGGRDGGGRDGRRDLGGGDGRRDVGGGREGGRGVGGRDPGRDGGGREVGGRDSGGRDVRDAGRDMGGREPGRDARRRDVAGGRGERGRSEPSPDGGRGRFRSGDPSARRRDPGADSGRSRDDRGGVRRDSDRDGGGREAGRDERGGSAGRQPRRRPPEDHR